MTTSPRLGFTDLESGETNPGQAVAEISRYLEQGASGFIFKDRDLNDPTALTPTDGDCYLINGTGAGDWLGHDDEIAFYMNTGWLFIPVQEGFRAWVIDEAVWIGRETSSWVVLGTGSTAASKTQTGEQISGFIAAPSDKDYKIVVKMAHAGTITETTTISASGTCTATFKVNSTALGGTANSVSSSEESQAHASTNTFSAGDDIVLTVSSNSSCADMSFTIKYTRTLA